MSGGDLQQQRLELLGCFHNRLVEIIQVEPVLDFIQFMNEADKEEIRARKTQKGNQAGARLLLTKITQRTSVEGWFVQFVTALREGGCSYAAQYIDPEAGNLMPPSLEARNDLEVQLVRLLSPTLICKMTPREVAVQCFNRDIFTMDDLENVSPFFNSVDCISANLLTRICDARNCRW